MLPCLYDDPRYAAERLGDTVVRLQNGDLIYVYTVHAINRVTGFKLSDVDREINVRLSDLDISPLPLGWTLYGDQTHYLMRRAVRRYKQGTSWNNLSSPRLDRLGGRNIRAYKLLETPVYQRYPDWKTALQMVEDAYDRVPLSRDFAIQTDHSLFYRSEELPFGRYNQRDQRIYINPTHSFLVESVEEKLNHSTVIQA